MNVLRRKLELTLSAMVITAVGCSPTNSIDYSKVELVSVSGTVTLDGSPLSGAVITFDNTEMGTFSFARTDSSGRYTLQFDSEKQGVTPGRKVIQISTTRSLLGLPGEEGAEAGESSSESGQKSEKQEEKVPKCYNSESKLTVEVTSSSSTFNFELRSDCSTTGATP
ncbi:MAG: carboxypeptidase-like regulatory domain-containing protein [Planctomycetota bacterium]